MSSLSVPAMINKVAIVTGASNGIGLATCEHLLAAGWSVLGVDVATAPSRLLHAHFKFLQANLSAPDAPRDIVALCLETFGGRIDALLNVAGVPDLFASAATITDDAWEHVMAINLTAPVRLMREVIPTMKAQKSGSIVNVSSKAGMAGASAGIAYTVSKHGLIGATKNTAWLLKDDGIRCNAICPGGVNTSMFDALEWDKIDQDVIKKSYPGKRSECRKPDRGRNDVARYSSRPAGLSGVRSESRHKWSDNSVR